MNKLKTRLVPMFAGLLILSGFLYLHLSPTRLSQKIFQRLNQAVYDVQLSVMPIRAKATPVPIVIVDVDEASLRAMGRWPWRRHKLAYITDAIHKAGALMIGFDIIFTEEDVNPAKQVLDKLHLAHQSNAQTKQAIQSLIPHFKSDDAFVKALSDKENIMAFYLNQNSGQPIGELPKNTIAIDTNTLKNLIVPKAKSYIGNMALVNHIAPIAGFTTTIPDSDGIIRKSPLVIRYQDKLYGSLPLEMMKAYLLLDKVQLVTHKMGNATVLEEIKLGDITIPTDEFGQMMIPYLGTAGKFPTVSAKAIFTDQYAPSLFENAIVLIGASAFSLGDLHSTPLQNTTFPGVEIQATILQAMLSKQFLWQPGWRDGVIIVAMLLIGLIGIFIFPFIDSVRLIVLSSMLFIILYFCQMMLRYELGIIIPTVKISLLLLTLTVFNTMYGYLFESRKRLQLRKFFEQYVPKGHVAKMSAQEKADWFAGESRNMSVMFCDLSNFTDICEGLSASEIKRYLNEVFTPITKAIFERKGTIDKYVGDLVMAFWGAPLNDPKHVENGLLTVLDILAMRDKLSATLTKMGFPPVAFTLGYNTGIMDVGDMGSMYRRSYTVIGDAVNLASRLEMLCKDYGVNCIVSEFVEVACDNVVFKVLDRVQVKGKTQAVTIYEPLGLKTEVSQSKLQEVERMKSAYSDYLKQQWSTAKAQFESLLVSHPGELLYQLYLDRIRQYEKTPPPIDWDGVTVKSYK